MSMLMLALAALFVVCFLLGSIPFGVLVSKILFKTDLRDSGSGNIGATNALRVLGKKGGAAVFLLDFGKGLLAGALGVLFVSFPGVASIEAGLPLDYVAALAGSVAILGAVMGHIFSPWLGFHGGKGVAVTAGSVFSVFGPLFFFTAIAAFLVVVLVSRYVSLGSMVAVLVFVVYALYSNAGMLAPSAVCLLVAALVVWAHRSNIQRLVKGTENKLSLSKK